MTSRVFRPLFCQFHNGLIHGYQTMPTKLTPQPCRWQVDGGWREGEWIVKRELFVGTGMWEYIVRDTHTGEYFELSEPPELIQVGSHPE